MADLKRIFEGLDRLDTPVSWSDVKRRSPSPPAGESERPRRILIVGLALAIGAAGVFFAMRALVFAPSQRPSSEAVSNGKIANGKIAFVNVVLVGNRERSSDVFVMNSDGSGLANLTPDPAYKYNQSPAWSPEGAKIAFSRDGQIWVMNADGTGATRLTDTVGGGDADPAWSPDGRQIAFWRDESEVKGRIFLMNADGTEVRELAPVQGYDLTWSPDGTRLAFWRNDAVDGDAIFVVDVTTGRVTKLSRGLNATSPAWSPDGTTIAFAACFGDCSGPGPDDLYLMDADGSNVRRLTNNPRWNDYDPAWSPDGAKIAFVSDRDGNLEIYSMSANGTSQMRLTNDPGQDASPAWQPLPPGSSTATPTP